MRISNRTGVGFVESAKEYRDFERVDEVFAAVEIKERYNDMSMLSVNNESTKSQDEGMSL